MKICRLRVLLVYLIASYTIFEAVEFVSDELPLPDWALHGALAFLLSGLLVVATSFPWLAALRGSRTPFWAGPVAAALGVLTAACAGATYRSGVGDRQLDRPPYYAGRTVGPEIGEIAYLRIAYQRGGSHDPMLDPVGDDGSAVSVLLAEMNAWIESHANGRAKRLHAVGPGPGGAPDVRFGCVTDGTGDCIRDESHDVRRPLSQISVARPTGRWVGWVGEAVDRVGATHMLVLTLEVGQLWPRQKNLRGDKVVELGTNYTVALPWLTSLDTPVTVVQITGSLVDRDGRAVRVGAEGLLAKRTSLLLSSFDAQALIEDEDVTRLRSERRADLPGAPLVWEGALNDLLAQLTGR